MLASLVGAQDRTVLFDVADPGVSKAAIWGLDTAWYDENNVRRGAIFMGSNNVDVVRISFTTTNALVAGQLGLNQLFFLTNRLTWVDRWANPSTTVCINEDSPTIDAWYYDGSVINSTNWAANIVAHAKRAKEWGRTVVAVAPFNEPDFYRAERQANMQKFYDTAGFLVTNALITTNNIRISGGNTLNTDQANPWYDFLKARLDEGNTHQLAGNFNNYASFFQNVSGSGDHPSNDELHNVMEAMVGAQYGLQTGIWWGTAERARGEFVKASDGVRLGYEEHRGNWTAASVYRTTNGAVQAFVGESERQALPTTYRFFSQDRDVFYDGDGPRRDYTVTTTGGPGYQTANHRNAERVVNITWGEDVQPLINGRYYIVARHSTKVMEVAGADVGNGANIQQNTFSGALNQQWDVTPMPYTAGGDYSYYSVTAAHSGKAPDVWNFSFNDGGDVRQYQLPGSNPGVNQQWFLEYVSNGWFNIRSRWSGKYLDVSGVSTADGANIHQWAPTGGLNQQWRLVPVGSDPRDANAPSLVNGVTATANPRSVLLTWNASPATDLGGYTVLRSTNSGGPYEIVARGLTNNAFADKFANEHREYYYVVRAVDKCWNSSGNSLQASATPSDAPALIARYPFDGDLTDSSVNANHPIVTDGSPTFPTGQYGSAMDLDGVNQSTTLPANMLAGVSNFTIAAWVNWDGGGAWQRIFDFGNGTMENMFLTPSSGDGTLRFAITTNGGGGAEQRLNAPALPVGQWRHVAVTCQGNVGCLYTNGQLAATNLMTITPLNFNPAMNYLGKSQYPDPLFNGRLDDFFVYNHALSQADIVALANHVVPGQPAGLTATPGNGQANLNWAAPAGATGYNVKRSTTNGGPYLTVTNVAATAFTDSGLMNGNTYYYVVSGVNAWGEGINSSQAGATLVSIAPVELSMSLLTSNLSLSWPEDHTGWRLQMQTNTLFTGLSTNWMDVPDSQATNSVLLPLHPQDGAVFYRLVYP